MADQVFKNCENVLAVTHNGFQYRTQLRLADGFFVPLGQDGGGDLDVLAQLVGGMPAQEQAVEKGGLALRELKILQPLFQRIS